MIRIDVRSARGEVWASVSSHPDFDPVLAGVDRKRYPIFGHVDPYGDTVLNRMQVKSLLAEIGELRSDERVLPRGFVEELLSLCEQCLRKPHSFLWFIGE